MIVVFLLSTLKEKLPIFLINTLLLHIPLLAFTDSRNYGETNTLALRGLEEPAHASRGLEELFSSCAVVLCQFLVLAGNAGTCSTLFSGGLFWDQAGSSFWCYVCT